jgi:energy-coupling factor transport system permease protein
MIRDITIGQYYPSNSILHRLDPRVKLAATVLYIISLFLFRTFYGYIVVVSFLFTVIKISKVPFRYIVRGLKAIIIILVFTSFFNIFFTPGKVALYQIGAIRITPEGLRVAAFMCIRLIFLIIGSSLMTFTTTPNQLTDGLEKAMRPLNKVKVPVHEIAMMMSIALRFIPILLEETDKIMKAQMARGADFETGGIMKRAKSMIPLLVPLFVSAFRRANDLAMAMEARCYRGGDGRTKMKPLKYQSKDFVGYFALLVYMAAIITVRILE